MRSFLERRPLLHRQQSASSRGACRDRRGRFSGKTGRTRFREFLSATSRFGAILPALTIGVLLGLSVPAFAEITLHQDFDQGALLIDETTIEGDWVYFDGPDNYNSNRWKWFYFRVEGVEGRQMRFQIGDHFAAGGGGRLAGKEMVYREEGGDWEFFDNNVWDSDAGTYTFHNDFSFTADTVWVAYSFPYPFQRVIEHVDSIKDSPWVSPTASSNDNLIIGASPGGIDDRGRSVPQLPLFGYKITDPDSTEEKERMVFCSGVHSNEVLAGYVLEGLVDWLVSDDPRAAALRREVEFYVYPMVVPDGRYAGYNRGGVQHPDRDTNRFWREDLYEDMDDIRQIAEAMKTDTGSERVSWVIDFHSWTNTQNHFVFINSPGHETDFWNELTRLEPSMEATVQNPGSTNPTTRWFALNRLNADYGLVAETMFRPGEYPERFIAMGRRFGLAFFEEVAPELVIEPEAEILMLVQDGHNDEGAVRGLGAWIESERFGKYTVSYSADQDIDVLDSSSSLSSGQRDLLESFDLIIMPRRGAGGSGDYASTDWNTVSTPLLNMNPFTYRDSNWRWMPGNETSTSPAIQDLVVVDESSPLFNGVDTSAGLVTLYREADTTMQPEFDSSILTGNTLGWTDRVDAEENYLEYPWIVTWEGTEDAFYDGGTEAPGGRRMLFLGQFPANPDTYTAEGQRILLNAIAHLIEGPRSGFEGWLTGHFTESERNDPAISGPEADPDGDGIDNLLEYVLDGDPRSPDRSILPELGVQPLEVDGEIRDYLTLDVTRVADLPGVVVRVEISGDLLAWEEETVLVESVENDDGTVTETYRDVEPIGGASRRFMRVEVELP